MSTSRRRSLGSLRSLGLAMGTIAFALGSGASAQESPKAAPRKAQADVPAGAEKAVAGALAAFPGATLEDVVTPAQAFGLGGEHDAYWTMHLEVDGVLATVNVGGDGILIRASRPVETKDLPSMVTTGMARRAPKGAAKITKLQTFGVVRYVAMAKPQARFTVRVMRDDGKFDVTVAPDGTVLDRKEVNVTTTSSQEKEAPEKETVRTTDGPIPEPAARAVAAMRSVFPDMVFDQVEEVPYLDSTTQTMEMLWYEVEFFVDGVKHEFNATPDGIVISYRKRMVVSGLPRAAAEAISRVGSKGTVEGIFLRETRAESSIVALDKPVVVYEIEPVAEAGAKPTRFKLREDGTEVKAPELPDWAKTPEEKEGG